MNERKNKGAGLKGPETDGLKAKQRMSKAREWIGKHEWAGRTVESLLMIVEVLPKKQTSHHCSTKSFDKISS